ncbi:MAG TPA: DnaB-like helicase C-terminal domain-containing protein, partial [Acidimicrobiales bacterium]|nr:DnaB-like helicase C-terminal domain-containing protein [Acidimicrobiales bacterium]
EVAQRRVVDTMSPLRELLAQSLDHLENLFARGDTITGVPTGYTDLDERLAGLQKSNLVVVGARPAMGKALALDTAVPTPAGWTTMGELQVGDEVFDEHGQRSRVTYCSPVFIGHRCYRVAFEDGTEIVADAGHRWLAHDLASRRGRPRVVTTEEMVAGGTRTRAGRPNWYVPVADPLAGAEVELPVEPYHLGRHLAEAVVADQPARLPDRYLRAGFKARLDVLGGFLDTVGSAATPDVGAVCREGARTELWLADRFVLGQVRELLCTLGLAPTAPGRRSVRSSDGARSQQWGVRWWATEPGVRPGGPAWAAVAAALARHGRRRRHAVVAIEELPSVPVRCIAVDAPSRVFLAGPSMVPTHNTSFALGIVANAAVHAGVPVLLFSLEMSHLELTQRLLCSEARVDATRMRNGRLLESDWPKISDAIGRLGDAPIYIDDNPNVTVMDIRAKARRLKAREGLGLVVVDYLQLMSGHQRSRAENRQVEVSEISRGLKVLARELDIPVVALSQLSRNLEMRQDKRPVLADLRESGCLTADTRVMRFDTGGEVTLGDLLASGERDIPVWALDERLRMVRATMTHVFASGIKKTYELRLASGRRVTGSANHPFRTPDGWRRLDSLVVGDWLAVVETRGVGDLSEAKVLWDDV